MRQARATWMIIKVKEVNVRFNKERKTHEMQLQLDIYKGVPMGKSQHKDQEDYEALAQGHGETKKGLPQPKGGISTWVLNVKRI